MSTEKVPDSNLDVEKQDNEINTKSNDGDDEPLEKFKERPPPGINASLVLVYAIFFFMFTIGWVNLNNCTVSRLIPIYLIVAGFTGALTKFISKSTNKHLFNLTILLATFYLVWHCLGTYWIYREYQPNYEEKSEKKYCNRTTYLLAFWMITLQTSITGFVIVVSACYMLMRIK